jgi:hypothetical protein
MTKGLNKMALLEKLERIKYDKEDDAGQSQVEQMSLAGALLILTDISHEREYALCHSVAGHLLDEIPEPDDADLGEE